MKKNISALLLLITGLLVFSCSKNKISSGEKYFNQGQFQEAVAEYSEELKYAPNEVRLLYHRGRAYEEMGDFENAKSDFEAALVSEPNNFQVLLSLANIHHNKKNFTNALLFSNRAADVPGAPAMASFMKARALHQLGKTKEALKAYGNAITLDRDFAQAYYNRGLLKIGLKNVKGACEDFQLSTGLEYPGAEEAFKKYCK
jgi:tetratricopeptide (TPR) repeat protein